jgi:hypothetical protein
MKGISLVKRGYALFACCNQRCQDNRRISHSDYGHKKAELFRRMHPPLLNKKTLTMQR